MPFFVSALDAYLGESTLWVKNYPYCDELGVPLPVSTTRLGFAFCALPECDQKPPPKTGEFLGKYPGSWERVGAEFYFRRLSGKRAFYSCRVDPVAPNHIANERGRAVPKPSCPHCGKVIS